ncbi:TonB-dependent receptor [Pedobacter hiemivivus]|uniref:TonB-dependent receptor n=1 Tax=Pedobacter hiemivivus TaxID=2530454 RepID=A0A4U1GHU1_9SPHI|nr:TonB-dependent receptor [Pedobacter hiemivivus]TKC63628.1 TonB-dependent receptor [Pedobacter hiemivivus]
MIKQIYLLCAFLLFQVGLHAQEVTGLTGTVHNQKGNAIAGAAIHLLNTNYSVSTNSKGSFNLGHIPFGKYNLQVSASDYATSIKEIVVNNTLSQIDLELIASDKQLDEVVVTAQKSAENINNVPLSITTISASQVEAYGIRNVRDIRTIIPNLYAGNPGDGRNVVSVRGIVSTSYDPAIATYVDGVNQFGLDTYISDLLDVERIEVLRGPQGTLYGRNAMGGVINIITKQPGNTTSGFAGIDAGTFGQQRYRLGLRTPLIENKLFFGATGMYNVQNGIYTNEFTNARFDQFSGIMGSYFLKYLANDRLSMVLNVKHNANRNNGTFPLVGSMEAAFDNPFKVNQDAIAQMVDNLINASLAVNYVTGKLNVSSQTAYQSNYRFYKTPIDGDFSPLDIVAIQNNFGKDWNKVQVLSQEFKFSSSTAVESRFNWTGGLYGFYQHSPTKQGTHYGEDAGLYGSPIVNFTNLATHTAKNMGVAAYAQLGYAITPQLSATAGLRYDYEYKKLNGFEEIIMDGMMPSSSPDFERDSKSYHAFSPKVILKYQPVANSNWFASYNKGFRAGGINQTSTESLQFVTYRPENSNSFEIGSKNTFFNERLRVNAAVFYTEVNDAQVPTLILPEAITVTKNAGKLRSKGAELEISAIPVKGLSIDYNLGYTDAKYTDLKLGKENEVLNLDNNRQVFTPNFTAMLALQYAYELSAEAHIKLIGRGEWAATGKQYFDLENKLEQKAYGLFNAKFGISSKKLDFFVWGRNLGNKIYADYAYDFGATHLGSPRTYGLSISTKF